MARKLNKVKIDLRSYPHYIIMGVRKSGKTTLFRDLVLYNYHDASKGLLISCGAEDGYRALDDLQYEEARTWDMIENEDGERGLVQIVDELLALRGTDDQIEMVCFDTLDELVDVATQQVYEEHRDAYMKYPKSLNDALGGYGAGQRRVASLIKEQIGRLNNAGMAVFIIAHTKLKDKEDPLSGEKYEMITNNLESRFYDPIADTAQMIVNIVIDRKIEGAGTVKKKVSKDKEIDVEIAGKQIEQQRYMYFRENNFVDAGGRFPGLPEKLPLSAENFMKAFEMGVKSSQSNPLTKTEEKKRKEEENEINQQAGVKLVAKELEHKKAELSLEINTKLNANPDKEILSEVLTVIKENGIKGFDAENLKNVDVSILEKIVNILN